MESKTYGQILDERYVNEGDSSGGGGSSMGVATVTYTSDEYRDELNSVSLENLMTLSEYLAEYDGEVFMEQAVIDDICEGENAPPSKHIIGNHLFAP